MHTNTKSKTENTTPSYHFSLCQGDKLEIFDRLKDIGGLRRKKCALVERENPLWWMKQTVFMSKTKDGKWSVR